MCKKHHHQSNGIVSTKTTSSEEDEDEVSCQKECLRKKTHTRGLMIYPPMPCRVCREDPPLLRLFGFAEFASEENP
jgi:hypothetical protein